jgi:AAA15 family ATPase/GTPase
MKITKLQLINFKRFTDLSIEQIPVDTKLVLSIGANGSGKSSLFDAFVFFDNVIKKESSKSDTYLDYFRKKNDSGLSVQIWFDNGTTYTSTSDNQISIDLPLNTFYGRTSFRQLPRLTRTSLGQGGNFNIEKDSDRPRYFIERDNRFENDIEKITETILKDLFRTAQSNDQIRQKYINPINESLARIFGEANGTKLELIEIIPPLEGNTAQITFRKGASEMHYNYLSAGEKEVFNVLINLLSRAGLYNDTIYYFDELDLHLNTKVQFNFIREITEYWLPDNCQLWTASHSLGFIEYAKQADNAVIIDFDELDFDIPRILLPEPKDNPDIYEIAVSKAYLPSLFQTMKIYFVENKDRDYYASVGIPNSIFVSDNNRNNVFHKVRATQYQGIVDRDFLSDDDIKVIKQHYSNLFILAFYSIENYLFHPDNLADYWSLKGQVFDKDLYINQLTDAKNQVKNAITPSLSLKRTEYPYFGEPIHNGTMLQNRFKNRDENFEQSSIIASYLDNDNFDIYYKVLPMKSYCTHLPQRQNIPKSALSKTLWFKNAIEKVLRN